ncbi:multifunctional oxoglutarate decarboxylase/oxoglutarate dehydrogenase thiamine pyrophosphate-binding subunit/dihydrolipoyllysine-residue succinyltransferase subunit [Salisaeta longa]|uniref:multifunctional oxoglutarate decarboxylase/oxoglutarate dehydrogenase thiamine pyrophosphate-binding subunit/dihydrolipoyllysine-residue succinyltransferase subunit n=1 Tax=Salisaeta longa TaxID=503170 RepID=UPI0003B681DF|nr:multifunctional oxoglutarate decarboxylase/oxoglutarate dehydrogenase thiamine pyrophosphate-binding subunit/dihydrolipoyllysine-residue succinyltransferase subunit [Salisaeta longa]
MSSLGFNTGYIEELYKQYQEDPNSVSESWREFFADYHPDESFVAAQTTAAAPREEASAPAGDGTSAETSDTTDTASSPAAPARPTPAQGDGAPAVAPLMPASAPHVNPDAVDVQALRGPAAKIVENMENSLGVPTATSARTMPVKLLIENRKLLNEYQRQVGGEKVSFTHIIAYAIVQGLKTYDSMYTTFRHADDGTPERIVPKQINLGLAIDIERRGKRTLLVPNVKDAGSLNFAQFLGTYNDLIDRARNGNLEISDFEGTNASLTNPGMIGTSMSVARLMPGQGVIIGAGAIGYPPEYRGYAPDDVSRTGVSPVMTLTSTYDHRVIQGAESGAFLNYVESLLMGEDDFYEGLFADLNVPYQPFRLTPDSTPQLGNGQLKDTLDMTEKQAAVLQLIRAYRVRGHLQADTNPLGYQWQYHKELDPATYGLTVWDLDREFITGGLGGEEVLPLREILSILREAYTRKIGTAFMHLSDPEEKGWIQHRIEPMRNAEPLDHEERKRIMQKLNAAEAFERFLHTKYIGHKRFSLEGAETMIPLIDTILSDAADAGVQEAIMGMAHRGRLNVLANIIGKPYEQIFSEFEGNIDPSTTQGSGDVKYHLGASGTVTSRNGATIEVNLASNPSHLEAVNPTVEGMVRAKQNLRRGAAPGDPSMDADDESFDAVFPLLVHGDAAFPGQGVVAETLNLSQLRGYKTGGTIHLVINNQIGFTTVPADARSSTYATDLARAIEAPIFHVNGDDPEACVRIARLALEYRQRFNKDVVIDMMCYRVHGHNEGDEPTFTQPLLYEKIEAKRSARKLYTELLLRRGEIEPDEAEQMLDDYRDRLQEAFDRTKDLEEKDADKVIEQRAQRKGDAQLPSVDTTAQREHLERVVTALTDLPADFNVHRKLKRQFDKRDALFYEEERIDWAFAETLALGTLLQEGTTVRMSGQDTRRATFSQRHAVLIDQETGEEYTPLNNLTDEQATLLIYDSLLSEYAASGFEYGYSVADPEALVVWEAQFGDFANGAQIIWDQFVSSAEEKWGQTSSLVLLLPHGFEGQGPEHSSARLERYLQLCAEQNMIVANFSTPANYFHALRRQVKRDQKKPLVIMTPKSLLRHPLCVSSPQDLVEGGVQELIPATTDPDAAERHIFCSGKVYYDLVKALEDDDRRDRIAITRIEQYYPFPKDDVRAELERYAGARDVLWVQEEPENMGAWSFLRPRLDALLEGVRGTCEERVRYVGRPSSASPATGSAKVHKREQEKLVTEALDV